jgi:ABC-2 type transport system ATP-binding protein
MSDFSIEANNLSKKFGDLPAVQDLSFKVRTGEIYGLVGPDGAGKTTTIRMLATIMRATSGEAKVAGYDLQRDVEKIRLKIGYVAQVFNLYQDLTVSENLDFFAGIYAISDEERNERKKELLRFSRLDRFLDRRAGLLSGGMQKKLAVSCALMHEPEILLLDEPTIGVDPLSRQELWDILLELNGRGVTLLVSTTYMDEAERFGRLAFIDKGKMIAEGTPAELKQRYAREVDSNSLEAAWRTLAGQGGDA